MATAFADAVAFTISNTPGSSSGFTFSAVLTGGGFLTPTQGGCINGESYRLFIREPSNGNMEIRDGCVYNSGTGAFTRGTRRRSTTGSDITFTSAAIVNVIAASAVDLLAMENIRNSPQPQLTSSFRVHKRNRCSQGACYWNGHIITATDRKETFTADNTGSGTFENILTIYTPQGIFVSELLTAYTDTDPGGKFMSFGAPFVEGDFLYMTVYNINDGGSPLIGRAIRYTLDPAALTITRDMSFGTSGAVSLGSGTPEHVSKYGDEWFVCFYDNTYVARYNSSWVFQANHTLSQAYPADGGPEAMVWEGSTVYINMHGPNFPGQPESHELHQYTWTGSAFTYVQTLTSPAYGASQGFSKAPWGYVWADRTAGEVLHTPGLVNNPLRPYAARSMSRDIFKPTLLNSWVNFDATYDRTAKAYYDRNSGRVHLEGIIKNGTTTLGTAIFNLPVYLRPTYSKNFCVASNDTFGAVGIVGKNSSSGTPGDLVVRVANNTWLSLDGVSWLTDD